MGSKRSSVRMVTNSLVQKSVQSPCLQSPRQVRRANKKCQEIYKTSVWALLSTTSPRLMYCFLIWHVENTYGRLKTIMRKYGKMSKTREFQLRRIGIFTG